MKLLLLIGSLLAVLPEASASILVTPAVRYESVKTSNVPAFAGTAEDSRMLSVDGKLGLVFDSVGFYLGGLYRYEDDVRSSTSKLNGTGTGASVGFVGRELALIYTHMLSGDRTYKTGSGGAAVESKMKGGEGFQIDLSFVAGITSWLGVGPQLTYRSLEFTKSVSAAGVETTSQFKEETIEPAIVFWYRF